MRSRTSVTHGRGRVIPPSTTSQRDWFCCSGRQRQQVFGFVAPAGVADARHGRPTVYSSTGGVPAATVQLRLSASNDRTRPQAEPCRHCQSRGRFDHLMHWVPDLDAAMAPRCRDVPVVSTQHSTAALPVSHRQQFADAPSCNSCQLMINEPCGYRACPQVPRRVSVSDDRRCGGAAQTARRAAGG
jgi:hypothetical protein